MNLRHVSLFASVLPLMLVISSIPVLGFGFGLEFAVLVWAGAGFSWFLLSVAADTGVMFISTMTSTGQAFVKSMAAPVVSNGHVVQAGGQIYNAIQNGVQLGYGPEIVVGSLFVILSLPLALYWMKHHMVKLLSRIGYVR